MNINQYASNSLAQLAEIVEELGNEKYAELLPVLSLNSIGKHIRHIIEFYQCLVNALNTGCVDYDARERNILLETDSEYTLNTIKELITTITKSENKKLQIQVSYDEETTQINTSFFRELVYNIEHTTHHLAIIKIAIETNFPEITLPENFGLAYSTIKYQQQLSEQA